MTRTSQQCISPDKLMAFLRNQVSQEVEADLQLHLEECEVCRQRLDESAAQRSDWEEAGIFLGQSESGEASDEIIEDGQGSSSGGWLIRQVLETLGPRTTRTLSVDWVDMKSLVLSELAEWAWC